MKRGSTGSRSPSGTTPIQIGENFAGLAPMAAALEASASDYVMPDLDRIGGVTGWQRAAGLAAAYNREVSSHLFPEVSAHLLAATPGRHWLEFVDWAVLLQEPLQIVDGLAIVPNRAGNGMRWDEAAVASPWSHRKSGRAGSLSDARPRTRARSSRRHASVEQPFAR